MKWLYSIAVFILSLPTVVFGAELSYKNPMVQLPGYSEGVGLEGFVNVVYGLSISLAALLAVVKIVIAGVKWMLSDVVTEKTDAKKDIEGALFGLIIIISAVLIITIINPDIVGGTGG